MDILRPKRETRYDVTITFKSDRQPVVGFMPRREYKRMRGDVLKGKDLGAYEFVIEGHVTEMTFPLVDIDTIMALPEIIDHEPISDISE